MPIENKKIENTELIVHMRQCEIEAKIKLYAPDGDVNKLNFKGQPPVFVAAACGDVKAISLLKAAGANVNTACWIDMSTPAHIAAEKGHVETVIALLDSGADSSIKYLFWWTPLDCARAYTEPEHKAIVQLLEKHYKSYSEASKTIDFSDATESTPLLAKFKKCSGLRRDKEYGTQLETNLAKVGFK